MKIQTPLQLGVRLYLTALLGGLFSAIFLVICNSMWNNIIFSYIAQFFAVIILGTMFYSSSWRCGSSDYNKVKFGHMEYNKWKGFYAGLFAIIPFGILTLFGITCRLLDLDIGIFYKIASFQLLNYVNALFGGASVAFTEVSLWKILISQLPMAILPVFSGVGYVVGYHRYNISEHLTYRDLDDDNDKNRQKKQAAMNPKNKKSLFKF